MAVTDQTRRQFLSRTAGSVAAFLAAAVGVPLAGAALAPAIRQEDSQWTPLGPFADFPLGQPKMVSFTQSKIDGYLRSTVSRTVWVYRSGQDQVVIYNGRCTHLGCLVNYQASSRTFNCPCHGGIFTVADGAVIDGPPPRPLDRLLYHVEDGRLLAEYHDFLVGVPDQTAL